MKTIEVKNAVYSYGGNHNVVLPELQLGSGEHIFIAGASGSGKTTLLGALAGTHIVKDGIVLVHGREYKTMRPSQRDRFRADHIGYVFQQFNLINYLTVYENIALAAKLSRERMQRLKNPLKQEIEWLSQKLQIAELLGKKAGQVSVGQSQRIAIARALLGEPEIVLADEPTSALDADNRHRFIDLLFESLGKATTLIFVSHDRTLEKHFERTIELKTLREAIV